MAFCPTAVVRAGRGGLAVAALLTALLSAPLASAQVPLPGIMAAGDTIVTGFPGVAQPFPPFPSGNPLDETFIDLNGASLRIQRPTPAAPPAGQLIPSPTVFTGRAGDLGQVFAIAIDDQLQPNIFVGASSVYGIQIVAPDSDGDSRPERIKTGQPGAMFMAGQWGLGGTAGAIYRIDGLTGAISLFTTIGANAGPGLGDLVYDPSSHQFFVSDLDTGLIYRLDWTGLITDTYDHGLTGRLLVGLLPIADDGSAMNIASPAFNAENPATWGYTQPLRRVWGLAVYGGRLFYAGVDGPKIYSVGIRLDGTFANDTRWELDVVGPASANPVSDIVFDAQGRMILAQRGAQRGSYDYSVFADPQQSSVLRYRREIPDNPATPGWWVPAPDEYAIGFRPNARNTTGGIALGYGYDQFGRLRGGACNEYLWTTGESLRESPFFAGVLAAGGPATVHGLQGNPRDLVRPLNDPPFGSYFTDYDGQFIDPMAQGHIGDVEIWQPCRGVTGTYLPPYIPPYFPPPGYTPPPGYSFNLTLDKRASYDFCLPKGAEWECLYTVRVTNTGPSWYWGPITVNDWLPVSPPITGMMFQLTPPWGCLPFSATNHQCAHPPVFLLPGQGVDLYVNVTLPAVTGLCYVANAARLIWPPGGGDSDPGDDFGFASAAIPAADCRPPIGETTNLTIDKLGPDTCESFGDAWLCRFLVIVTNDGTGAYDGDIVVTDTLSVDAPASTGPLPPWMCVGGLAVRTCTSPAAHLDPGASTAFEILAYPSKAEMRAAGICKINNSALITFAPAGSPLNTIGGSDDEASFSSALPAEHCLPPPPRPPSDLLIAKGGGCGENEQGWYCMFGFAVKNEGPGAFFGSITIRDMFLGLAPGDASDAVIFPAYCAGALPAFICNYPAGLLADEEWTTPIWITIQLAGDSQVCRFANGVEILAPVGPPANTDPGNDVAIAAVSHPSRDCPPVELPRREPGIAEESEAIVCPVERRMPSGMCCPAGQRWNGRACAPVGTPPPPPCPPGSAGTPPNCTPTACPPGTTGTPPNCSPTQSSCPPGTTGTPPNCRPVQQSCPPGTTGTFPNCVPIQQVCPPGSVGTPPNCRCPAGTTGTPPNCRPITQTCPQGTTGTFPNCVPVQQVCPPGSVGTPPNCRCPQGTTGTPPNCRPITQTCPQGTTGTFPNCVPVQQVCPPGSVGTPPNCRCPQGTTGTPPNCRPITQTCPQGTTGTFPNCVPIQQVCPPGSVGTPPNCRCPAGTIGTPPNCRRIVLTCPQGTTGTFPNCVQIQQVCPPGSVGTPPNCRCPQGTVGTPPNCRPLTNVPGILQINPQQVPR